MDCSSCGGELLSLQKEIVNVGGTEATFHLAACMGCGEVTRSEVAFSILQTM